ncbi:hypothetical protein [Pseudidiomarina homiensis]|uniref:Uncharacterized protein n=1 Tax=Pseudidiomarina homiensis TaxID=364198 RepID=A0A432XSS8_9GAMM|nr:hypothetical protein [Pseudidiomarina homiensis]RUO51777.1 hypothetical protein CWI70_12190 [Pseudidiomarina homiensis]
MRSVTNCQQTNNGQATVETLVVALSLFAIVVIPVTANNESLVELVEIIVSSWMLVFSVTWQQFLLHPWAA